MNSICIISGYPYGGMAQYAVHNGEAETLTVAELIAQLSRLPADAQVFLGDAYNQTTCEIVR